jgi:acyl-CoA thioesterase-1
MKKRDGRRGWRNGGLGDICRVSLLVALLVSVSCDREKPQMSGQPKRPAEETMKTIVAVGDSLTAGLGLAEEDAYPAQLEKKLQADGYNYRVINAGVSAETSSGTLARLDWVLSMNPDVVILETGANDGLRGIEPQVVESNVRSALNILKERDVVVLLAGMKMVRNLGPAYVASFNALYPKLAEEFKPVFFPFFLQDVAMQPSLNQADGIHPTAAGYKKVVDNIYPYVLEAIRKTETR